MIHYLVFKGDDGLYYSPCLRPKSHVMHVKPVGCVGSVKLKVFRVHHRVDIPGNDQGQLKVFGELM